MCACALCKIGLPSPSQDEVVYRLRFESIMSGDDQAASSQADMFPNVLTIAQPSILTVSPTGNVDVDLKADMQEDEEGISVSPGGLLSNQRYLVSPSLNNPTLQSLLTSPTALQGAQLGLPDGIQIINLASPSNLVPSQTDGSGRIWHVISPDDTIIAVGNEDFKQVALANVEGLEETDQVPSSGNVTSDTLEVQTDLSSVLMPPPLQPLPPGCPAWAARLKSCEKIGDYYRGYVDTDVELDILLTYHKQATQSFWGTRQSPSPAKQSTRFMWKSQYVPYDGVPFVNTGSRAVVMECQYGPRRKASWTKKQMDSSNGEYKQTCPARIYIKKVRKFPEFKIDTSLDKKAMKISMDKAFHCLKQQNVDKIGQDRYYVQLPLPSAHEYHFDVLPTRGSNGVCMPQVSTHTQPQESQTGEIMAEDGDANSEKKHRLHPLVAQKIRDIVAGGEVRVYHVRRLLRMFVCQELYQGQMDANVSRHDLSLFPTVTDLKNHIHQAVKDIENGTLALTGPSINIEPLNTVSAENMVQLSDLGLLQQNPTVVSNGPGPVPETVTVTLTQSPGDDEGHVISRIETHMSDGTTQISSSLTPETAQLLARLNPAMFPPGSLVQLKADNDCQMMMQAVTSDMNHPTTLNNAGFVSINTTTNTIDSHTYSSIDLESQTPEESLNIQSAVESALNIQTLDGSHVTASIITGSPSLTEQSTQLIPTGGDLDDMQTDSCEDEL
ncbi:hypothetical protein ACF0H5_007447 [Mactra antiquata]